MLGLFGLPSIQSIVEGIVNFFFQDVARALVPEFLKNASVSTIKWLVAVPDPSSWTHIGQLEGDMGYLAVSLLSLSFTAAVVRYLVAGLSGSGHPLQALASTCISAGLLVGYPWAASQMVAMVNTLTNAVLSFPIVGEGLRQTVGIMFGGALLVGSGGIFLALLVIVGVVLGAIMFALKVLLLLAFALLYVTGPLVIAVRPLPELAHLSRTWGTALLGVSLVPIGWTILFAVAGALSLDATSFGGVGKTGLVGALPTHVAGVFAALLTFFLAVKLPFGVLDRLRGVLGGVGGSGHAATAGGGDGGGFQRVADANARLRSGTLQAGRAVGLAASALGAPAGGPVGAAARAAGRLSGPLAFGASFAGGTVGARVGKARSKLTRSKAGQTLAGSSRAQALRERFAQAGRVLSEAPAQARDAARSTETSKGSEGKTGADTPAGARPDERASRGLRAEKTGRTGEAAREGTTSSKAPQPKQHEPHTGGDAGRRDTSQSRTDVRKPESGRKPDGPRTDQRSGGDKSAGRSGDSQATVGVKEQEAAQASRARSQRPPTPARDQGKASSGSASKREPAAAEKSKRVGETPSGVSSTDAQQSKPQRSDGGSARAPRQDARTDAGSSRAARRPRHPKDGGSADRPRSDAGGSARAPREPQARASGRARRSGTSRPARQTPPQEPGVPGRLGWFPFKRANGRG